MFKKRYIKYKSELDQIKNHLKSYEYKMKPAGNEHVTNKSTEKAGIPGLESSSNAKRLHLQKAVPVGTAFFAVDRICALNRYHNEYRLLLSKS
jgi:hypothetical protein